MLTHTSLSTHAGAETDNFKLPETLEEWVNIRSRKLDTVITLIQHHLAKDNAVPIKVIGNGKEDKQVVKKNLDAGTEADKDGEKTDEDMEVDKAPEDAPEDRPGSPIYHDASTEKLVENPSAVPDYILPEKDRLDVPLGPDKIILYSAFPSNAEFIGAVRNSFIYTIFNYNDVVIGSQSSRDQVCYMQRTHEPKESR